MENNVNFAELTARYRSIDKKLANMNYKLRGVKAFEHNWVVPSKGERARLEAEINAIKADIDSLPAPDGVYAIMKSHFSDFLGGERIRLNDLFTKPDALIGEIPWRISSMEYIDSRPADERCKVIIGVVRQLSGVWSGVRTWLNDLSAENLSSFIGTIDYCDDCVNHYSRNINDLFYGATQSRKNDVLTSFTAFREYLSGIKAVTSIALSGKRHSPAEGDDRILKIDETEYRNILSGTLGVNLDELLSWYESEIDKTRDEVMAIASRVMGRTVTSMREVNETLNRYAGPADTPDEMLSRTKGYLARTREASREFVKYPEEYCDLRFVPYTLKDSFPWGGYSDGDGVKLPPYGVTFLNKWNFRAVTDGWMKIQAAHEAYPGHHLQYVRVTTDTIPETMKIGAKYIPLIEGSAHRSERMMEFVFPEDKYYPLFVAYRRHHTSVRIKCDLMLRYFGYPAREAIDTYMKELDFDENTARGQVLAQERMPGYFTCYYYGLKKLTDWERQGNYDEKAYTELLFSSGNVSLTNFKRFIDLSKGERDRYRTEFKSLFMK